MTRTFESIYAEVPPEQRERLKTFRATHSGSHAVVNGVEWEYIACGQGETAILWLVGGLRVADAAYRSIPLLENYFRIIAPTYPQVNSMNELTDGLAGLLEHEGLQKAHVLSGSFGGMVAQALVRRHPECIDRMILSTTTVLDSQAAENYRQQAMMIEATPPDVVAEFSKGRFLEMVAPPDSERLFWTAYIDELFTERLTKADLLSTVNCMLDFAEHIPLSPDDLAGWPGRILIIESEDDATFDAEARQRLRSLYPMATVHTFTNAGHSPGTTQRDAFFTRVHEFLG